MIRKPLPWLAPLLAAMTLGPLALPAAAQSGGRPAPPPSAIVRPANSLTIAPPARASGVPQGASHADLMRTLGPVRQLSLASLRNNPVLTTGTAKVDFRPMLDNPQALPNIAQRLQNLPDLVEVREQTLDTTQVRQGVLLHSRLSYRLKPGACRDAARRARVTAAGVNCFSLQNESQREAAYADPRDARFVADPRQRAEVLKTARVQDTQIRHDIDDGIAQLRTAMKDPQRRAELATAAGADELARLEALDDTLLAGEMANAGEVEIEQVAFLPDPAVAAPATSAASDNAAAQSADIDATHPLERQVFLTGFTLGGNYHWEQGVKVSIKWCLVGCKATYHFTLYADLGYGFGLRFPIEVTGKFEYTRTGGVETARVTPRFEPFDGDARAYRDAGLDEKKIFDGKELVAEASVAAGLDATLPVIGHLNPEVGIGLDFTSMLGGDFKGGQVKPPKPGAAGPSMDKVFDTLDLLGGRANLGVIGGQIFPALNVSLVSHGLTFSVVDKAGGKEPTTRKVASNETVPLGVDSNTHASRFQIKDPLYNLGLKLIPGLDARLFIDLAVWHTQMDWLVKLPQLGLELPAGGANFSCHAGTVCAREYRYTAKGGQASAAASQSEFEERLELLGQRFENRWIPECSDEICRIGIRFVHRGTVQTALQRFAQATPALPPTAAQAERMMGELQAGAEHDAKTVIAEATARQSMSAAEAWARLAQEVWTRKCEDKRCYDNVAALARQMPARAQVISRANPEASSAWVTGQVGREFGPRFQSEIDASKSRAALARTLLAKPLAPRIEAAKPRL